MDKSNIFSAKNVKIAVLITLIITLISLGVSFLQTPKYEASVKLLTIFNQNNIDPYTASKTSDYINSILGEVIYSNSFIQSVMSSQFHIKDTLGSSQEQRAKNWKNMVKVQIQENKGIIAINVYNPDRNQADQLAQAIAFMIINNNQAYHGLGDKVSIKMIDQPYATENWAEPKIGRNAGLGAIAGLVLGLTFIFIFPEQEIFKSIGLKGKSKSSKDQSSYQLNLSKYGTLTAPSVIPEPESLPLVGEIPTSTTEISNSESVNNTHSNDSQFYKW
jgi:capsular polysaccharide biosynthesis protein